MQTRLHSRPTCRSRPFRTQQQCRPAFARNSIITGSRVFGFPSPTAANKKAPRKTRGAWRKHQFSIGMQFVRATYPDEHPPSPQPPLPAHFCDDDITLPKLRDTVKDYFPNYILDVPENIPTMIRDRSAQDETTEIEITPEMIEAGKVAFYKVLDMPPFSDATVTDLVSEVAYVVVAVSRHDI